MNNIVHESNNVKSLGKIVEPELLLEELEELDDSFEKDEAHLVIRNSNGGGTSLKGFRPIK
jgi:hypothetical protein